MFNMTRNESSNTRKTAPKSVGYKHLACWSFQIKQKNRLTLFACIECQAKDRTRECEAKSFDRVLEFIGSRIIKTYLNNIFEQSPLKYCHFCSRTRLPNLINRVYKKLVLLASRKLIKCKAKLTFYTLEKTFLETRNLSR